MGRRWRAQSCKSRRTRSSLNKGGLLSSHAHQCLWAFDGGRRTSRSHGERRPSHRANGLGGQRARIELRDDHAAPRSRADISVVSDQRGCPTVAAETAAVLAQVTLTLTDHPHASVIYHSVSASEVSWSDFARAVFADSRQRGEPSALVRDIATAVPPAKRPAN